MITPIMTEIKAVQKVRDSGCTANFALLAIDSDEGTQRSCFEEWYWGICYQIPDEDPRYSRSAFSAGCAAAVTSSATLWQPGIP
jgi:hypothetical protein